MSPGGREMAGYQFITTFSLHAPAATVFDGVAWPEPWLSRWRHVHDIRCLDRGDQNRVGARYTASVHGVAPYTLTWDMECVRAVRPRVIEWRARGDLVGTGLWEMQQVGTVTDVTYTWSVRTARPWMTLLAPVARPVFAWNHDTVMRAGVEALAGHLGVDVLDYHSHEGIALSHPVRNAALIALAAGAVGHASARHH